MLVKELSAVGIDAPYAADAIEGVADDSSKKDDLDDRKHDLNEREGNIGLMN